LSESFGSGLPQRIPPTPFDARIAWTGTDPEGSDREVTARNVEAASWQGRGFLRYRWRCPAGRHGICSRPLFSDDHRNVPVRLCALVPLWSPAAICVGFYRRATPPTLGIRPFSDGPELDVRTTKVCSCRGAASVRFLISGPPGAAGRHRRFQQHFCCAFGRDSLISWTRLQTGRLRIRRTWLDRCGSRIRSEPFKPIAIEKTTVARAAPW
jgi:hypothetical protein